MYQEINEKELAVKHHREYSLSHILGPDICQLVALKYWEADVKSELAFRDCSIDLLCC